MRKLFKFIFGLIFVVILIAVAIVIGFFVSLNNKTDDTPTTIYTAEANKSSIISATLSEGFDLSTKNYIDITFSENDLNLLIFCLIREKINDKYLPVAGEDVDYTNEANYVWKIAVPSNIPLVGGKGLIVKSVYTKIEDGELKVFCPALIGKKQTCIELYLSFDEDVDTFNVYIDTLKIGKINYAGGNAKKILKLASKVGLNDDEIEKKLNTGDLKFDVSLENLKIGLTKDSLQIFLSNVITKNVTSSDVTRSTLTSLSQMLTSKENDMLDLGVFVDRFGVKCDMSKADVDPGQLVLNPSYSTFDETLYITSVTQGFAISNISSSDPKITISETDFNAMIYSKSNGYQDFKVNFPIPNSSASINLAVNGIDVDLSDQVVIISVILDLNGLKTVIEVSGAVSGNNSERILITLDNEIKIGKGLSEPTASYIKASSDFIKVLLAEKIDSIEMMEYDSSANALVLSASNFNEMLSVTGGSTLPVGAKSLTISETGLDIHVNITDPVVEASLEVVTNAISNYLENSDLTSSDFNTTDPEQEAAVNSVLDLISSSGDAIGSGSISEEDTDNLINAISNLSDENKEVLYNSIEGSILTSDLTDLYDSLFGK